MAKRSIGAIKDDELQNVEEIVEIETKKKNIKRIKIIEIEKNELNHYPMTNIPDLADNILENGLLEPLIGYITENGTFKLLGGHRRHSALILNLSRGGDEYAECITINQPANKKVELKMIGVLNCKREMDEKTKDNIVASYKNLYESLSHDERLINGKSVKMREWIGIQIGLSGRQVQTYLTGDKTKVEVTSTKKTLSINSICKKCNALSSTIAEATDETILGKTKTEDLLSLKDDLNCLVSEVESLIELIEKTC